MEKKFSNISTDLLGLKHNKINKFKENKNRFFFRSLLLIPGITFKLSE